MNKELILKYKDEFDYWLKGGEILCCKTSSLKHTWGPVEKHDKNPIEEGYIYAINDKYAEFRKALAEGKTVEFKHPQVNFNDWEIVTPEHLFQSVVPGREYRIKPEEPKFKVGDWVRMLRNGNILQWTQEDSTIPSRVKEVKLWQPQPDDYAWFYDYEKYTPTFGKFMQIENGKYLAEIADGKGSLQLVAFTYCEPFLNTLPTFLKPE